MRRRDGWRSEEKIEEMATESRIVDIGGKLCD